MRLISVCGLLIAAILVAMVLAGCATTGDVRYQAVSPTIPKTLRSCGDEPYAPKSDYQRAVAGYVVDLRAWGRECRDKLGRVVHIVDEDAAGPLSNPKKK